MQLRAMVIHKRFCILCNFRKIFIKTIGVSKVDHHFTVFFYNTTVTFVHVQVLQYKKKCGELEEELSLMKAESDRSRIEV